MERDRNHDIFSRVTKEMQGGVDVAYAFAKKVGKPVGDVAGEAFRRGVAEPLIRNATGLPNAMSRISYRRSMRGKF